MSDLSQFNSLNFQAQPGEPNSGNVFSTKLLGDVLISLSSTQLANNATSCIQAFDANNVQEKIYIHKYETNKIQAHNKRVERRSSDLFAKLNTFTTNQVKNQNIRFGLEENNAATPRNSTAWPFKGFNGGNASDSREYEDVLSREVLEAPICDICIVQSGDAIPDGFYRCYKTPSNKKANLNNGSGGNPIYLCIKKDMTGQLAPISNLLVIFPDRNEFVPPGYHVVQRGKAACNINTGTGSERVYLCFKRDFLSNPIVDIQVIFPNKGEDAAPKSFFVIEKSISGLYANLNIGTSGVDTLLCYRQDLIRLSCLLNESSDSNFSTDRGSASRLKKDDSSENLRGKDRTYSTGSSNRSSMRSKSPVRRERNSITARHMRSRTSEDFSSLVGASKGNSEANTPVSVSVPVSPAGESRQHTLHSVESVHSLSPEQSHERDRADTISSFGKDPDSLAGEDLSNDFYDECCHDSAELINMRKIQEVVDATGAPVSSRTRRILHALLSAVYIRHGVIPELAVVGLTKLLKDTDFFEHDLKALPIPGTITMLDMTIETICDRFELSSEAEHERIMIFLKTVIKHSGARLSPPSLQRLFRTIYHICSCSATKPNWMTAGLAMPCNEPGVDMTPFKVLKHLIWDSVAQTEYVDVAQFLPEFEYFDDQDIDFETVTESYIEVREIVEDLVDETIDAVDVSRICESALQTISKQSTASNQFWQTMNVFSRRLFLDPPLRSAYVILAAICSHAWQPIRTTANNNEAIPRDLGSKLVALEAIAEYCLSAGERLRMSKIMGYQIRRIVVPCICYNVPYALTNHRVFSKVLKVITALWKKWRRHIRIEFAILCEQLIFKVLQASFLQVRPIYQMIAIQEITNWFDQPHMLIEMFINYDMDRKFVSHWNTFSYLIRSMCAIGRKLTVVTGAWDWKPNSGKDKDGKDPDTDCNKIMVTIRDVHSEALVEVSSMAKTLMDASGHAYLMMQDAEFRNRSLGASAGWVDDDETGSSTPSANRARTVSEQEDANLQSPRSDDSNGEQDQHQAAAPRITGRSRAGSIKQRRAAHMEAEEMIKEATKIYKDKGSLKKAVKFLTSKGFMPDTPQEIANFLRVYKNNFDPAAIGDFLGEGGITMDEEEYWSQIRFRYTRAVSFVEMEIEAGLRLYLTGCGFRLPGEAQKINRFVEVFVKAFWQDNSGTPTCTFKHPDTLHLLSYAIIMLNTDLHRANIDKNKKSKKMTKDEFINNLRGADQGSDIAKDILARIYDNIAGQAIELAVSSNAGKASGNDDTKIFSTLLNNATNKKALGRSNSNSAAAGITSLNNAPVDDAIAISSLTSGAGGNDKKAASNMNDKRLMEEKNFVKEIGVGLRDAEDLLRSLAPFHYRFQITNVDTKISLDLVSYMFETVWFYFHAIVESVFQHAENHTVDVNIKFVALDILCYSLTSAIFLDLKVERMQLAILLKQFRQTCEAMPHVANTTTNNSTANRIVPDDSWYEDIENATADNTMDTIAKLHHLMVHLKDTIQESMNYEMTRQVATMFEKKAKVMEKNSFFVRQGDLQKIHGQGGSQTYRFFLFSDHLIYAHLSTRNKEYIVHEQLSLNALTVSEVETDMTSTSFFVQHPIKSFVVVAESPMVKQQWLRDINQTIANCKKRENIIHDGPTNRRMSIIGRIESQHELEKMERTASSPEKIGKGNSTRRHSYRQHLHQQHLLAGDHLEGIVEDYVEEAYQAVPFALDEDHPEEEEANIHTFPEIQLPESSEEVTTDDTPVAIPTAEERVQKQQEGIQSFNTMVATLSTDSLNSLFNAGFEFWRRMGSSRALSTQTDPLQLKLYALHKQARFGSYESCSTQLSGEYACTSEPSTPHTAAITGTETSSQVDAWKEIAELPMEDAKREFLKTLFASAPYWKYEQFLLQE